MNSGIPFIKIADRVEGLLSTLTGSEVDLHWFLSNGHLACAGAVTGRGERQRLVF
jgi:hypothetical protein